jgi:NADPH:quinone reductase-like Zn-dependent oxidoreductase
MAMVAASGKREQGGFQDYLILDHTMTCNILDSLSFLEASGFPLCITTAAFGLFSNEYLGLAFPSINPTNKGQSILI